jgi:hypothetical protein
MKNSSPSSKTRNRLPGQIVLALLVLAGTFYAILITGPTDSTVNPVPTKITPSTTGVQNSPADSNAASTAQNHQTDGVIISGIIILAVVLIGTGLSLASFWKQKQT